MITEPVMIALYMRPSKQTFIAKAYYNLNYDVVMFLYILKHGMLFLPIWQFLPANPCLHTHCPWLWPSQNPSFKHEMWMQGLRARN